MAFTTCIKTIYNTELPSSNIFPNNNENITDEDELYNDVLAKSYKTLYLKLTEEYKVIET